MAEVKPRVRIFVSMKTGECSLGLFESLLWWVSSPLPLPLPLPLPMEMSKL